MSLFWSDQLIIQVDEALKTLFPPKKRISERESPAQNIADTALSSKNKTHTAGLMRVNHSGEVCAQALYQGQALTAALDNIREQMQHAALEEVDHLAWCEERLNQLDAHPSHLNPIWYGLSFLIGAFAGALGDKWSLGFVVETEEQVGKHLNHHLSQIAKNDEKTRAILEQMIIDELGHAKGARQSGAHALPLPISMTMSSVSKLMTWSSYYV